MPLIERVSRNLIFWVVILLVLPAQESQAEVITIEASVLSIDPSERTIPWIEKVKN